MIALIQRVKSASVKIKTKTLSQIKGGLLIFLGVGINDSKQDVNYLCKKIINLRIFPDNNNKMNLNVQDICGSILVVSQFTLYGNTKKGNRPSFSLSAKSGDAEKLYKHLIKTLKEYKINLQTGKFGANMDVNLINDGPVTLIIKSEKQ